MYSNRQVQEYGNLISDKNPIHSEQDTNGGPSKIIVHGMLSASVFSSIFGSLIPGSIYRSQTLDFKRPVYANISFSGRVHVIDVKDLRRGLLVTCRTNVYQRHANDDATISNNSGISKTLPLNCGDKSVCIEGVAQVWLPGLKSN